MWDIYTMDYCACLSRLSHVRLFATPWTVAHQALLSTGFSRQEYWSELPALLQGNLPDPGIKPALLMSPALAGGFFPTSATWEARILDQMNASYSIKPQHVCGVMQIWLCRKGDSFNIQSYYFASENDIRGSRYWSTA